MQPVIIIEESLLDSLYDILQKKEIRFTVLLNNNHQILDETKDEEDYIIENEAVIEILSDIDYNQIFNLGREIEEDKFMKIQFQRRTGR